MSNKKLLLVSANEHKKPYPVYPLGISYLETYLKKRLSGFDIHLFDFNLAGESEFILLLQEMKPDYIGVSLRNIDGANSLDRHSFIYAYRDIIRTIRAHSPAKVIIGGAGFSIYPQSLFDLLQPDYGIRGEGEETLYKLIVSLESKQPVGDIEGLVFYQDQQFVCNPHRNYLKSLDVCFASDFIDYYWEQSGMLNIQTKRGCSYKCIYCSYPLIDGRTIRTLDTDLIVENLTRLYKERQISYVFFTDSVFNLKNSYNIELAEKIIKSGIKVKWGAYFSPSNLTDEMLALYKRAGLTHVEFGTESFSDIQLQNYGKHFTFADVVEKSELCLKNNIFYAHFLILGGYGETEATWRETIENSKKIQYSVFFPYVGMRIYPGTRLQQIAIAEGRITHDDPLLDPVYYISDGFDLEAVRREALATGKAWIFPDDPESDLMDELRLKRKKKGPIWEYMRKP